jgi:hypothetical protein
MILTQQLPGLTWLRRAAIEGDRWAVPKVAASHALFGVLPVLLTMDILYHYFLHGHLGAVDFHHEFWPAAQRVLHGQTPYNESWMDIPGGVAFPYPAFTALVFVPFALLSHTLADWLFTGINVIAALLTLRTLNVRDWRLYGLVMLWPSVVIGWQTANLTLVLGLGIAYLWRRRENPLVAGVLVAMLISLKPSMWPVGLWLLATRRYRALAWAVGCGLAINAVSWGLLGFNQVHGYLRVLSGVSDVAVRRGYSVTALVLHMGTSHAIAYAFGIAAAAAVGIMCMLFGRRSDGKLALALCIALCLLGTPVLHAHYFALLIVALALFRPQFDVLWLVSLGMWVCPENGARPWQILVALGASVIVFGFLLQRPRLPASADDGTVAGGPVRALTVAGGSP